MYMYMYVYLISTVYRETFEEENFREMGEIEDFAEKTFVGQWPVDGAHAYALLNSHLRMVPNPRNSRKFSFSKVSQYTVFRPQSEYIYMYICMFTCTYTLVSLQLKVHEHVHVL